MRKRQRRTDEQCRGDDDDQEFLRQDVDRTHREQDVGLDRVLLVRARALAEQEEEEEPQQQRESDRDDHHRGEPGPAFSQRSPQTDVERCRAHSTNGERDDRRGDQTDSENGIEEVRHQRAEHDLFRQCEVDEAGGAIDQRQTDRAQADDQPEDDAFEQQASRPGERAVALLVASHCCCVTLGDVEQHSGRLSGARLDRQLLLVGTDQFDALGQRVDLDFDGVRAGPGTGIDTNPVASEVARPTSSPIDSISRSTMTASKTRISVPSIGIRSASGSSRRASRVVSTDSPDCADANGEGTNPKTPTIAINTPSNTSRFR